MGEATDRWPNLASQFSALLTTCSGPDAWEKDEKTVIDYSPGDGLVIFKIHTNTNGATWSYTRLRDLLRSACVQLHATFACCDHPKAPRPNGSKGQTYYGTDFRSFPHREFLGWMGFVSGVIAGYEVPEADEVVPLCEMEGTIIVAVADTFDVHNRTHIEKAQRVEMRLVDLEALPVTDSRLLQ